MGPNIGVLTPCPKTINVLLHSLLRCPMFARIWDDPLLGWLRTGASDHPMAETQYLSTALFTTVSNFYQNQGRPQAPLLVRSKQGAITPLSNKHSMTYCTLYYEVQCVSESGSSLLWGPNRGVLTPCPKTLFLVTALFTTRPPSQGIWKGVV